MRTDWPTDRQTDKQTDRQTDRTTDRLTLRLIELLSLLKTISRSSVTLFITTNITLKHNYSFYTTCSGLILWLVELLSQLKMQNMTTEWSNNLNYNSSNNIYTLPTALHYYKTCYGQTDRQTDRLTVRPTDRHCDL